MPLSSTSRSRGDEVSSVSSTAVDVLVGVLAQLEEVSEFIPVPYFKLAVMGLYQTVVRSKRTIQNSEDITELVERVKTLREIVIGRLQGQELGTNAQLIKRIEKFSESVQKTSAAIEKLALRNPIIRFVTYADDAQKIAVHFRSLNWIIQSFTNSTVIDTELSLHEHAGLIRSDIKELRDDVRRVEDLILDQQYLKCSLLNIPIAPNALYDCDNSRSSCMVDTRTEVLSTVYSWIESHKKNRIAPRIFWLDGLAGTGKSTIAQSVAEYCATKGRLGASFFFSREDSSRSSLRLVFTTIAEQLALFFEPLEPLMREAIKKNPHLAYTSPSNQFEKLILEPLSAVATPFRSPVVIVIDALDECHDEDSISIILRTFSYYIGSFPFLVFITSRPEPNIERGFELSELQATTRSFLLHHVEPMLVDHDITLYLRNRLGATAHPSLNTTSWFSADHLRALVVLCEGLFIFASTAVRYIQDPSVGDPRSQLDSLLSGSSSVRQASHESSPYRQLDRLYSQVLRCAFPKSSSKSRLAGVRMVIGAVVLVREPQSASDLSALLGLKAGITKDILQRVQSLISERGDGTLIHILHASFADFIQTDRCIDRDIRIEPGVYHAYLATQCFHQMKALKMDMCQLRNPSIFSSEIMDLSQRVTKYIPPILQYSCRQWSEHIQLALLSDDLLELLWEFTSERSLFWLEALSLMGCLESAIPALKSVQGSITKLHNQSVEMLHDLQRFILEFFGPVSAAALHVYFSALPFTPNSTLLYKSFAPTLATNSVIVRNGVEKMWDACLYTMEGHSESVISVAFSPDGRFIASASRDKTVRLWDAATGTNFRTLKGHTSEALSVVFSPDGRFIASGSYDKTVQVWDAVTGTNLRTLKGHVDYVSSVAFSPDRRFIVSSSGDRTVRMWDTATGTEFWTLRSHSDAVLSVAFSPDGRFIVSASRDKTVRVWDVATATKLMTLIGHSGWVRSVVFSPDCRLIVSGSDDKTVRVWDAATGSKLRTLKGHSGWVHSITFSPDGTVIASGSADKTVGVWDAATGTNLGALRGYSDSIHSVAFSPDGRFIASGSFDKTVRVWDAAMGTNRRMLKGHSGWVYSVVFSPDGRFVASGSGDKTVRVWDAGTGTNLGILKGHSDVVYTVAFSPDGSLIVSGSDDEMVRVWDAGTGEMVVNPNVAAARQSTPSFTVKDDGWVYTGDRSRRVCWVPAHCRPNVQCSQDDRLVLGTRSGAVIFLDFSACTL